MRTKLCLDSEKLLSVEQNLRNNKCFDNVNQVMYNFQKNRLGLEENLRKNKYFGNVNQVMLRFRKIVYVGNIIYGIINILIM